MFEYFRNHCVKVGILIVIGWTSCVSCQRTFNVASADTYFLEAQGRWNRDLTWIIIEDIFTPPVASRIYAYPNLAAYEAMANLNPSYKSLAGQLTAFETVSLPQDEAEIYTPIAAMVAFTTVAKELVFAFEKVENMENEYFKAIDKLGIPSSIRRASVNFGRAVGEHVLAYANQDGYHQRQALEDHDLSKEPGAWEPTPPTYMPAIEPHWNTLRPFTLDSASQFRPDGPALYDSLPYSDFYEKAMEVYQAVDIEDEEKVEIAKFWDCNPNIAYFKGHVMMFHQKISPGGHWISITDIASRKENLSFERKAEVFALSSIAMADAFISCWDEKYRSNLIRPETYIERYIDSTWFPILETPAFPEHTSGHSVVSAAASEILTTLIGENVSFVDTTEKAFDLPIRVYDSFYEAAAEAAISRLYGGIHYRPAIDYGVKQGKLVGKHVIQRLSTKEELRSEPSDFSK